MKLDFMINEEYLVVHALSKVFELLKERPDYRLPAHIEAVWALAEPVISSPKLAALMKGLSGVSRDFYDAVRKRSTADYYAFIGSFNPGSLVTPPFLGLSGILEYIVSHYSDFLASLRSMNACGTAMTRDSSLEQRLEEFIHERIGAISEAQSLMATIQGTGSCLALLESARSHMRKTREEWLATYDDALPFMRNLTRISFDDTYVVYVVSPEFGSGSYLGQRIIECPAMVEDDRFRRGELNLYTAVYLWHEVLHDNDYLGFEDVAHAVIELVTDNALRIHLAGGAYEPLLGHNEESIPAIKQIRQAIF